MPPKKVIAPAKIDINSFFYKERYSLEQRQKKFSRAMSAAPDRVPVWVEPTPEAQHQGDQECRDRYLAPKDLTANQFQVIVRERLLKQNELNDTLTLFLYTAGCGGSSSAPTGATLVNLSESIGSIHDRYKDSDGCLYMRVSLENTFGGR